MALQGNAGFRYTPSGGTEKEHRLNFPLKFTQAASRQKNRKKVQPLDRSVNPEIWTVGGSVERVATRLRFDRMPSDLLHVLEFAADGGQLNYYPDLNEPTSYPLLLDEIREVQSVNPDDDRWEGHGEFERELVFRSADGTSLKALYTPVLFRYMAGHDLSDATFSRGSSGTYRRQDGNDNFTLVSHSSGLLRDGHWVRNESGNWVRATKLEASRTNSVLDSGDLSSTNWSTTGGVSVSTGGAVGPSTDASFTLTDGSTGSEEHLSQDISVSGDSQDRVFSCFIHKQSANNTFPSVDIEYAGSTNGDFSAGIIVDTTGATVQDTVGSTGQIANKAVEDWNQDVVRAWVAVTNDGSTASTTIRPRLFPARSTGSGTTVSATTSYDFWGAQLEGV